MSSNRNKILGGFLWKFAERISSQCVTFVLSIILARLLSPAEYGTIAMINIFIAISNVFITNGFSTSLIQNKDADDIDFSTNLYLSLSVSAILYVLIFLGAPRVAQFYGMPELCDLTRVYCLSLFLLSYNSIQNAWVSRHMKFKKFFFATLGGSLGSGIVGVFMAYNGFGVWSLVAQYLSNLMINLVIMQFIVPWKPRFLFSWNRGKKMFKFGGFLILSGLLGTGFNQMRQMLVGKVFCPAELGLFNRAHQFPNLIHTNIDSSLSQVLFPAVANYVDDPGKVKQMTRRSIRTSSYVLFFFLTLLAATAYPFIKIILTDKWIAVVPLMQIMCLEAMLNSVSTVNLQTIKAMGRSDLLLKMELKKKPVFFAMLIVSVNISLYAVVWCMPLYALYANYINMSPNKKILGYAIPEQIKDYLPASVLAFFMYLVVYPISLLDMNFYLMIFVQVIVGSVFYIVCSVFFKLDAFMYLKEIVADFYKKKRKNV